MTADQQKQQRISQWPREKRYRREPDHVAPDRCRSPSWGWDAWPLRLDGEGEERGPETESTTWTQSGTSGGTEGLVRGHSEKSIKEEVTRQWSYAIRRDSFP